MSRSLALVALAGTSPLLLATALPLLSQEPDTYQTHLGVRSSEIVNIETMQLPNDNNSYGFFYDRQGSAPFVVPEGFSFVVTDVFVLPTEFTSRRYLLVATIGCCRSFKAQFIGSSMRHYSFTGGFVVPGGASITARNTPSSQAPAQAQILGYFVKGPGLGGK